MRVFLFLLLTLASGAAQQADMRTPPVSGGVMAGQLLTKVAPVYPKAARDAHVAGGVVMHAHISSEGLVKDLQVMSGPAMLRDAATDAVRQWTYKPFVLNGRPTEVDTTITLNFSLPDSDQKLPPGNLATNQPASLTGPIRVSSGVMSSLLIKSVEPVFPREAIDARVNGAVVCHVVIGKDGKVRDATVISGPEMLRKNYLEAIRQWEYRPYLLNGEPVEVITVITLTIQMGAPSATGVALPSSISSAQPAIAATFPLAGRIKVSSGVMFGRRISGADISPPPGAAEESGSVVLHVLISETGDVKEITRLAGPPLRTQAVIAAVSTWKYKPYLVNGEPQEVETQVAINW